MLHQKRRNCNYYSPIIIHTQQQLLHHRRRIAKQQQNQKYPFIDITTLCYNKESKIIMNDQEQKQDVISDDNNIDDNMNNMLVLLGTMIGSTTSIVVAGLFFIALSYQRNAFMISFFIGAIINAILSKILKRVIKQNRPPSVSLTSTAMTTNTTTLLEQLRQPVKPSDNGMPSSHAMSLGFIGTFVICHIVTSSSSVLINTIPFIALYCMISLWYRIYKKLHTFDQILVGSIVGSTNGYLWYQFCKYGTIVGMNILKPNIPTTTTISVGLIEYIHRYGTVYSFVNENGQCSIMWLLIPLLIGAATVGSIERRIAFLLPASVKKKQ